MLLTTILVAGIYWPGLHGEFFFDDGPSILHVEGVKLEELSAESVRAALTSGVAGPSGRPISQLSFALNHYFSGFDPFAFKATNLVIHALAGIMVFLLALRLLAVGLPGVTELRRRVLAGTLAIVWLLHPIQVLAVLHVVQRMTSLSALFLFTALLLHVHARERTESTRWIAFAFAWGVFWPFSFLSKETGAVFPLFVLAYELILRQETHDTIGRFPRILATALAMASIATIFYMLSPAGQWIWAGYAVREFTLFERLMTEGRVLWFYIGLVFLPRLNAFGLYHDDFPISTSLFHPWTTFPALVGLVAVAWLAWRIRARAPLVSFGIAWFAIGHGMESTFLPLELAHEHRNYVPLFGLLLAGAYAVSRVIERTRLSRPAIVVLAMAAVCYPAFVTALRAHQFGDEVRRTQIETQYHENSARAHYDAGRVFAKIARSQQPNSLSFNFARHHWERASLLDLTSKHAGLGLIYLDCLAGDGVIQKRVDELARRLQHTPLSHGDRAVLYSLKEMSIKGTLCLNRFDIDRLFTAAISNPTVPTWIQAIFHSWAADYLALRERDLPAAQSEIERSLALVRSSGTLLKYAQLAYLQGRHSEARKVLKDVQVTSLPASEKKTRAELLSCLEDPASSECLGK